MSFISELKERRIVRILVSYAAAGWIAVEVVDQLVDRGILPEILYLVLLVCFIGGAFVAGILGWYHGEKGQQTATRGEVILLLIVATFTLGGVVNAVGHWREAQAAESAIHAAATPDARRLAVLYFEDTSDEGELAYLADGLTEELVDVLTGVAGLDVVSRGGPAQYRNSGLEGDSIARLLEAGTYVEGEVDRSGDEVRVDLALVDAQSGARIERGSFSAPLAEASILQAEMVDQMSRLLRTWLGEEVRLRGRRLGQANDAAWLLVRRGERVGEEALASLEHDDHDAAVTHFERADSLFAAAEELAPEWADPVVARSRLIYERSRYEPDPVSADDLMRVAYDHAERALQIEPRNADALEIRGTVPYVRWLLALEPDPEAADQLLERAEQDLRTATEIDPLQANAWNVLGHLYYQLDDVVEANLAARRAYEADAYLTAAPDILWRLWSTSYDLENRPQSGQWCQEGRRRFPDNPRFYECQLWNMSLGAGEPEIELAWALADSAVELTAPANRELTGLQMRVLVAGALARASVERNTAPAMREPLADSARAVLDATPPNVELDPAGDLFVTKAFVRALLGDHDHAVDLLEMYLTYNPARLEGFAEHNHWWWRDLRDQPAFRRMIGSS